MTPERRQLILSLRLDHSGPATPYQLTRGFPKADALQFWNDARAMGLVVLGKSSRGAKILGRPSQAADQ